MKSKILNRLRGAEEFVSGQQLCEEFGVSRTAVWKAINQLKEEGYEIEAVHNKGYRLLGCPDIISAEEVKSRLHFLCSPASDCILTSVRTYRSSLQIFDNIFPAIPETAV